MSFECKSNALVVSYFLFLSALSSTLTMLRLALFGDVLVGLCMLFCFVTGMTGGVYALHCNGFS